MDWLLSAGPGLLAAAVSGMGSLDSFVSEAELKNTLLKMYSFFLMYSFGCMCMRWGRASVSWFTTEGGGQLSGVDAQALDLVISTFAY